MPKEKLHQFRVKTIFGFWQEFWATDWYDAISQIRVGKTEEVISIERIEDKK